MTNLKIALITIVVGSASLGAGAAEPKFVFNVPVTLLQPTADGLAQPTPIAPGAEVKFEKDKAYWIQATGKVPLLVLPQVSGNFQAPLKVDMPDVVEWPSAVSQRKLDEKLAELVYDMSAFQTAVRSKNVEEAERVLARMESVARLDYFHFLRATVQFMKGDIEGAKDSTRRGLRRYPANEMGQKFLKSLGGDTP